MHERLQEFREAITRLQGYLQEDSVPEEDFQDWFESNPIVFEALNYEDYVAHPKLPLPDGELFIPDLMAKNLKGEWEILELKRPSTKIIRNKDRRNTFYANLNEYIQQCMEYSKYFVDGKNIRGFEKENGFRVEGRPKSKLIAGRNEGIDRKEVFEKLGDRGHWVDVVTYDDVINFLHNFKSKSFVEHEGLPGISIHFVIKPIDRSREHRNQITMIGENSSKNMISIHFDINGDLVFEVRGEEGRDFKTSVSEEEGGFSFGRPMYFQFEFGMSEEYSTLSVEVNGCYNSFNIVDPISIKLDNDNLPFVLGSDCHGHRNSGFGMYFYLILSNTLHLDTKMDILNRLYEYYLRGGSEDRKVMLFEEHQFMYSDQHPNFT